MTKHVHIIILTLFAVLLPLQTLFAQPQIVVHPEKPQHYDGKTYYALWDLQLRKIRTYLTDKNASTETYDWSVPGDVITFDAKRKPKKEHNLDLQVGTDGNYGDKIWSKNPGVVTSVGDKWYNRGEELAVDYVSYPDDGQTLYVGHDARQAYFSSIYVSAALDEGLFIQNVKVTMAEYLEFESNPSAAEQTFAVLPKNIKETGIPNTTSATIRLNWCNVGNVSIALASYNHQTSDGKPVFSARIDANDPLKDEFNTDGQWGYVDIEIICNHDVMTGHHGEHTGTFTVTDEKGHTRTINVTSHTYRLLPKLIWGEQLNPAAETGNTTGVLNAGTTVTYANVAHLDEQEIPLKFISSNPAVIKVDETTGDITAIQSGLATITALLKEPYTDGTRELEALRSNNTITIEVTEKTIQFITWLQPELYRKTIADVGKQVTLTPMLSPDPNRPLVFEVLDTDVATVEGNTLIIKGKGVTQIQVTQAGDDLYRQVVAYHTLIVRDPNDPCVDLLYDSSFGITVEDTQYDGNYFEIPLEGKEAGTLTFSASADNQILYDWAYYNNNKVDVQQMIGGVWYTLQTVVVTTKNQDFTVTGFSRDATSVRFHSIWNPYGHTTHYTNVKITHNRYLEANRQSISFDPIFLGTKTDNLQTIIIAYSSLPDVFFASLQKGKAFSINKMLIGDGCGSTGEITITVDFSAVGLSKEYMGDQTDVLIITDEKQSMKLEIPISGYITKAPQTIIWDIPETNNIKTVDHIKVPAASDVNLPTNYLISDETIATVNDKYELEIYQAGTVVLTAQAAGNENYEPAQEVVKTFVISVTPYTVTGLALSDIAVGDTLKTTTISATILDERGNALLDGGEWTFEDPEYKFPTKGVYPVKMTFIPTRTNFYSPEPYEEIVNINVHDPYWLSIVPGEGDVTPQAAIYDNFLYMELDEHLADGQDSYVSLLADKDVTITKSQHVLLNATADDWRTFVAPFDISEVSIIEVMVEPAGNADYQTTLEAQVAANKAFKDYIVSEIVTNKTSKSLLELMAAYKTVNAHVAVYPLEHFDGTNTWTNNYYLYEGSDTWLMEGDKFIKSWNFIPQDASPVIKKGKTYAIHFPWCPYCTTKYWDYWTNKFVLLSHNATQGVEATNKDIQLPNPVTGTAMLVEHAMLAEKTLTELHNVFVHNTETDFYEAITETTVVKPTTSIIYANLSSPSGARAKAIARTGEIVWEEDAKDDVVTDLASTSTGELMVRVQPSSIYVECPNADASLNIYNSLGQTMYNIGRWYGNGITFSLPSGVYIVCCQSVTKKIIVP